MRTKNEFLKDFFDRFQVDAETVFGAALPNIPQLAEDIANSFVTNGKLIIFSHKSPLINSVNVASLFVNSIGNKRPPYPAVAVYAGDKGFMEAQVSAIATDADIVWGFTSAKIDDEISAILRTGGQCGAKTACFAIDDDNDYNGLCDHVTVFRGCGPIAVSLFQLYVATAVVALVDEIVFGSNLD